MTNAYPLLRNQWRGECYQEPPGKAISGQLLQWFQPLEKSIENQELTVSVFSWCDSLIKTVRMRFHWATFRQ
jgi:hypothetical protein